MVIKCHAKKHQVPVGNITDKGKHCHTSTYLLDVLSELVHLKHRYTNRDKEDKDTETDLLGTSVALYIHFLHKKTEHVQLANRTYIRKI